MSVSQPVIVRPHQENVKLQPALPYRLLPVTVCLMCITHLCLKDMLLRCNSTSFGYDAPAKFGRLRVGRGGRGRFKFSLKNKSTNLRNVMVEYCNWRHTRARYKTIFTTIWSVKAYALGTIPLLLPLHLSLVIHG